MNKPKPFTKKRGVAVDASKRGPGYPEGKPRKTNFAPARNREAQNFRAERFTELHIKGVPVADIAAAHGANIHTVRRYLRMAEERGLVVEVKRRLEEQLSKTPNVYEAIFNAPISELSGRGVTKAHELKLRAAESLLKGVGPYKQESVTLKQQETMSLDQFLKLRAARNASEVVDATFAEVKELPSATDSDGGDDQN